MRLPVRVHYLSAVRGNPYVRLLAAGVQRADSQFRTRQLRKLTWWHLLPAPQFAILHVHWAELQYSYGHPTAEEAQRQWHGLMRRLRWTLATGRRLVYTVHNLDHHEGRFPQLNEATNRWLFEHAHAIHVHDARTAEALASRYGRTKHVFMIPHGHYIGAYPNQIDQASARETLGLPQDAFVYLFLGQIRPYKGLDELLAAFQQMNDEKSHLLIAGNVDASQDSRRLQAQAAAHPRIHLHAGYVPDQELQRFFNAADVIVLPYQKATTSGAAFLAFSFARPIVAPALGPFPALIDSQRGVLYAPEEGGLEQALRQAQRLDLAQASQAALAFAQFHDWTALGREHVAMYRAILKK